MNTKEPNKFITINGNTLMAREFEPLRFSVDKILHHGIVIFAGCSKVDKSWLSLDLCTAVATGANCTISTPVRARFCILPLRTIATACKTV